MPTDRLVQAGLALFGVPAVLVGYIVAAEVLLRVLPERRRPTLRPWLWLAPALLFLLVFLVYPALNTIYLSFLNRDSSQPIGLANYAYVFSNSATLLALRNNAIWLVFFTLASVAI